jgi:tRNA A-37 threonylcarbamoyl transferase component Bud32/ActR/RegA family two-component response regulator
MGLRVLIIDDDEVFRRLLAQHVEVGFESPAVAEYDPATKGRLPADFQGSGYDVVLLDDQPGVGTGLEWLKDLRRRNNFPPVVYLLSEPSDESEAEARAAGAHGCLSRQKIDHDRLIELLRTAQGTGRRAEPLPGTDGIDRACRFGDLTIRGYHFVRKLAESSLSTVYLAESLKLKSQVVLKVLRQVPEVDGRNAETFDRFLLEYEIASRIRHPNVVRIFEFGAGDDYAYIAMEYFPRGDLRKRIKQGIEPRVAASLMRQMAEALQVLHAAGVQHRDLKPGNVMLRDNGSIVLIDFGMSKQVELKASITGNGAIFGTPYYMSPEQGHGRETDERSDLYSLGIIFYEMLMRRKPYIAGTPMQVIYKHANSPLPELRPELKRFESILHNCIAKDPDCRYSSAARLVEAVKEAERDEAGRTAMGF